MEQVYVIKNSRLLETARNIFGKDLVVNAWVIGMSPDEWVIGMSPDEEEYIIKYGHEGNEEKIHSLIKENLGLKLDEYEIDIGCYDIAIEFSNGNIVRISTSEWGDISKNKDEFIEIDISIKYNK